jgi:hypothetical protein
MKQLLLFSFVLLFFSDTFSQSGNITFGFSLNPKEIIKANKFIKEEVYSYNFNKSGVKDSSLTNTYYYDALGDLIEDKLAKIKNYDESITKYENSYNSSGKLRRQIVDKQSLKIVTIYEYDYDSLGNEVNKYDYNKDTTRLTIEQKIYNEKNQVVQLQTKINNNDFYISRKYYYNDNNELSKVDAFDNKGELIYAYIYEYDNTQNKKTVYLENGDGRKKTGEYFYNNDKQCVKVNSTIKSARSISSTSIEYDNFNQVTENIYNQDKTIFESNVYLDGKKVQMNRHFYFKE